MTLIQDGVLLLNAAGTLTFGNDSALDLLKLGHEQQGQPYQEVLKEPSLLRLIKDALSDNKPQEEEFVTSIQEEQRSLSVSVEPFTWPEHNLKGWIVLIRDMTAIKRLEAIERDFITNVSHELRTPLTSIKMAAESLQMGAIANEKLKERFLSNIQREADRLTRLVNELLVLSNVQGSQTTLHPSSFDLYGVLDDVMATMQPHARVNDIELVGDFPEALPMMVADRDRILQVLINLVDNAIKCNRPNGTVTLKARVTDSLIHLNIVDTGIGIPNIDLPRIFDRFFRVDKARSRVTGGTGLGLSIVRDIIESHGGTIAVESTVNVGTTFIIELPIKAEISGN